MLKAFSNPLDVDLARCVDFHDVKGLLDLAGGLAPGGSTGLGCAFSFDASDAFRPLFGDF